MDRAGCRPDPRPPEWRPSISLLHYSPTPFTVTCYQNGAFRELTVNGVPAAVGGMTLPELCTLLRKKL